MVFWATFMQCGPVFFFFPASCRRRSGLYGDLFLFNLFCFVQQRLFWAMSLFTRRLMSWQFFFSGPAFNLRGPTGSIRVAVFLNSSLLEWVPLRFGQRGPPFKFLERASEANASPVITTFALLFGGGGGGASCPASRPLSLRSRILSAPPYVERSSGLWRGGISPFRWCFDVLQI